MPRILAIVDRLRDPDGCPWDREQTVASMAPSLVEEAFEAVETIDRDEDEGTVEELGDLVMVVALIARIASESGRFDLGAIARAVAGHLLPVSSVGSDFLGFEFEGELEGQLGGLRSGLRSTGKI